MSDCVATVASREPVRGGGAGVLRLKRKHTDVHAADGGAGIRPAVAKGSASGSSAVVGAAVASEGAAPAAAAAAAAAAATTTTAGTAGKVGKVGKVGNGNSVSRRSSRAQFIAILHGMIQKEAGLVVSWADEGKSFLIKAPQRFAETLLLGYCGHKTFTSFERQMNFYR